MIARCPMAFVTACGRAVCATAFFAGVAHAQDHGQNRAWDQGGYYVVEVRSYADVVAALQAGGYRVDDVSRTFLGRVRITASKPHHRREVVISRSTGEIMSDKIVDAFSDGGRSQDPDLDLRQDLQPGGKQVGNVAPEAQADDDKADAPENDDAAHDMVKHEPGGSQPHGTSNPASAAGSGASDRARVAGDAMRGRLDTPGPDTGGQGRGGDARNLE